MKKVKCDYCCAGGKDFCNHEVFIRKGNGSCEYFRFDWKRFIMRFFKRNNRKDEQKV